MSEDALSRLINTAIFNYLRFQEKCYEFDVDDPIPADDPVYGVALNDVHLIYNQPEEDTRLQKRFVPLDVVTDGNMPLARKLNCDERRGLRRLAGRPKPKPKMKVSKKSVSRCIAVHGDENVTISRNWIGGLFATVSLHMGQHGHGNQILQLAEIKDSECKQYKLQLLRALVMKKAHGNK